jgi:hypothetical protein
MLSFHSDPSIKSNYITRVAGHADADEIVKGRYWENGKGCAVGCTIHGDVHEGFVSWRAVSWPDGFGCVWPALVGGRCGLAASRAWFGRFFGTLTGHRCARLCKQGVVFLRPRLQERIVSLCSMPW